MTAREYLERLRTIDRDINAMLEHKQEMLERATSIRSMPDGVCVQTATSSRVESAAVALADYGDEINVYVDEFIDGKRHALELIGRLDDGRHIMLLKYRYVFCWPWHKVAAMMCYDRTTVWRMRDEALSAFEVVWEKSQHNATSQCVILVK